MSDGEIKGLATSGLLSTPTARDLVTPQEFQVMIADAKAGRSMPVDSDADPFRDPVSKVPSIDDALAIQYEAGIPYPSLAIFRTAARSLKAAELAFRDAQQVYAEAVKQLSEEAVR